MTQTRDFSSASIAGLVVAINAFYAASSTLVLQSVSVCFAGATFNAVCVEQVV